MRLPLVQDALMIDTTLSENEATQKGAHCMTISCLEVPASSIFHKIQCTHLRLAVFLQPGYDAGREGIETIHTDGGVEGLEQLV